MNVFLQFGSGKIEIELPDEKVVGVYTPSYVQPVVNLRQEIESALENAINSLSLHQKLTPDKTIAIVVDDISRPVPSSIILSVIFELFDQIGILLENVVVIVALGIHHPMNQSELNTLLGSYSGKVRIINHDPDDDQQLVYLGTTSFQNKVKINRTFMEADFKILTGDIEYHQFCGYGGGAKSIFPGLADRSSIENNHSRQCMAGAEKGQLHGNPVRQEIEEVSRMILVDISLSVVLNDDFKVVNVFAGDLSSTFRKGIQLVDRIYTNSLNESVDMVIASPGGYPRDIDLYQSQKAVRAASKIVKQGGKVVVVAECIDGYGSERFYEYVKRTKHLDTIINDFKTDFILGEHKAYLLAQDIMWADVYLVSAMPANDVRHSFLKPIAIKDITKLIQESESIAVLPFASSTHVTVV